MIIAGQGWYLVTVLAKRRNAGIRKCSARAWVPWGLNDFKN